MADDPEISDVLLRTFLSRRDRLRESPAARELEIIGDVISARHSRYAPMLPASACPTSGLTPTASPVVR